MNRNYYKYDFISPEGLYSIVKEELKSYFATGAIDDIMFGTWTDKCLRHLKKGSYPLVPGLITIEDFTAKVPPNFLSVREAWACAPVSTLNYKNPSSIYTEINSKLSETNDCGTCPECSDYPDLVTVIYKSNTSQEVSFTKQWLLRPGNIQTRQKCADDCLNLTSSSNLGTFDIHGNKIVTNFREGTVFLLYYANHTDESGQQLIPDNYYIQEYIEAFIKYKLFEQLCNQATDETYRQVEAKKNEYQRASDEAYINASIESKKQTTEQRIRSIELTKRRNDIYIIK